MSTIKVYNPKLSVIAWHGTTKYDMTPYILQVATHKAMGETMGQWALLVQYREQKRWDKLLDKMDYVEISMARYAVAPKIIMRGFISNIRRTRVIENSGTVRKTITINGNDFGKLIAKYQLYYAAGVAGQVTNSSDVDPAQMLLDPLLSENMGMGDGSAQSVLLSDFIPLLINGQQNAGPIKAWIQSLRTQMPIIPDLTPVVNVLSNYEINYFTLQSLQGGLDNIINQYANAPWCEWFIYDAPDGPKIIHRNAPFKDGNGKYVLAESALGDGWANVVITDEDIIEDDVGTSDSEVFDYFFTYPSNYSSGDLIYKFNVISATHEFGNGSADQQQAVEQSLTQPTNPKILHDLIYKYGLQIMQQSSPAMPIFDGDGVNALAAQLSLDMNMWLVQSYGWAPDMINGTLRLKGNENITIGRYLTNKEAMEEYYVESVDQAFNFSQIGSKGDDQAFGFDTTVGVTRGRKL